MSLSSSKLSGQKSIFRFEEPSSSSTKNTVVVATYAVAGVDQISIDNSANTHEVFLKIFNSSSVTLGSVDPYVRLHCPAGKKKYYTFTGLALTALTFVTTKEARYSANTDATNDVGVVILAHA